MVDGPDGPDRSAEAAKVRAVWEPLGLPGLIDLHVHFMPERVLAEVRRLDDLGPDAWPQVYRGDDADRLGRLRAYGVLAFPTLLHPHRPGMAAWLNDWALGFSAGRPDVLATATFFPEPEAAGYVEEALGCGTRVFTSHLQVGAYDPRDPLLDPVWGMLADAGVPVVVRCSDGPEPGEFTGVGPFGQVLARHPRLTAVIAHLGTPDHLAFLDLADRYERVHLDTTTASTASGEARSPFPAALLPRLAELADRIVLGTDFPNPPHPYAQQLAGLVALDLGDDWLRGVLHHNADRLLAAA